MASVLRRQGRFDEAIRKQQEVVQLDPRSPEWLAGLAFTLMWGRRYEEADRVLNRVLTMAPDFFSASMTKAVLHEAWKGDTSLAREVLGKARGRLDTQGLVGPDWAMSLLLHNPREAVSLLDSIEAEAIIASDAVYPKVFLYALAHEALGDADRARREYETALPLLAAEVARNASRAGPRSLLARAYAGLGRKEDALREARRAVEALPISKDVFVGCSSEINRAAVEARVGETDAAIEHIRHLLSTPCLITPGLLRIDPRWAPLRNDPRFRKLAELE
jgi:serine/threonine-protein kinase